MLTDAILFPKKGQRQTTTPTTTITIIPTEAHISADLLLEPGEEGVQPQRQRQHVQSHYSGQHLQVGREYGPQPPSRVQQPRPIRLAEGLQSGVHILSYYHIRSDTRDYCAFSKHDEFSRVY